MILKIRYDDRVSSLTLTDSEAESLAVSLNIDPLPEENLETRLQLAFDLQFNRPEYNSFHKFGRHRAVCPFAEAGEDDLDYPETLPCAEDPGFAAFEESCSYEYLCETVRRVFRKKPETAEAFIAVRLDGQSIRSYAAMHGVSENSITLLLSRAAAKLRSVWPCGIE